MSVYCFQVYKLCNWEQNRCFEASIFADGNAESQCKGRLVEQRFAMAKALLNEQRPQDIKDSEPYGDIIYSNTSNLAGQFNVQTRLFWKYINSDT